MLIKRIKGRGANIVVEAHGEILMMPTGDVGRWKRRLTQRVLMETRKEAPTNKRPRWAHYGKPLKNTFTASSTTRLTKGGGFIYSAVGSNAPHAYYVDQGTGVHGGNGPYQAKILPPWTVGGASLYEHTWSPRGIGGRTVPPVMIRGQVGQHFFDKGLDRAWRSLGDARYKAIGGSIGSAMRTFPEGIASFSGNTPNDAAFKDQLREWRRWRDDAWSKSNMLGENITPKAKKPKKGKKDKSKKDQTVKPTKAEETPVKPTKNPEQPVKQGPTKAEIMAQYVKAIKKERNQLEDQAKAQYKGKNVKVSGRLRHDGEYAYRVTVSYKGREVEFWVASDYQAAIAT